MASTDPEIAAAARPALRLDDLPVDLLAHVALYIGHRDGRKLMVQGLLALRVASSTCKDAVRRAAKEHAFLQSADWRLPAGVTARKIAVWGRVFGSGCRKLHLWGGHDQSEVPSPEVLDALQSFVVNTQGGLRQLWLTSLGFSKSRDYALELCRASPQLKRLSLNWIPSCFGTEHVVTSAAMESFAMEVGRLCPLLECVRLSAGIGGEIPVETWQQHFPRLKTLEFRGRPENYGAIEAAARACVCADEVQLVEECDGLPAFVDMLVRTPLRGRLRKLDLCFDLPVPNEVILQCARGFEGLRVLGLPPECAIDVEFCRSLAQLRPTLTGLDLGTECRADDECLRILCESLPLEHLTFSSMELFLSPAVIDIILQSSSAQTLRGIRIFYMDEIFTPANLLRLVRGCPLLSEFEGDSGELLSPIEHGKTVKAINKLLKRRGGKKNQYRPFVDFGPTQWGRPGTLGGQAREFLQANEESEDDSESESGED